MWARSAVPTDLVLYRSASAVGQPITENVLEVLEADVSIWVAVHVSVGREKSPSYWLRAEESSRPNALEHVWWLFPALEVDQAL